MDELTQMKESLSLLHKKLQNERIVNERLLTETCKVKINSLHRKTMFQIIIDILGIPFVVWVFHSIGFSIPFLIFSGIIIFLEGLTTFLMRRDLDSKALSTLPTNEVIRHVSRFKIRHIQSIRAALALIFVWIVWLIHEIFTNQVHSISIDIGFFLAIFIGLTIGGYIGFRIDRKILHDTENILKDLQDK